MFMFIFQVFAANDVTSIFVVFPLVFFFNHKNKAFWTGMGQLTIAFAGLLPVVTFLLIPGAQQIKKISPQNATELLCHSEATERENDQESDGSYGSRQIFTLAIFFVAKLMMGVASATYWTLGVSYMVDAISPVMAPAALGLCYIAGYLGGLGDDES